MMRKQTVYTQVWMFLLGAMFLGTMAAILGLVSRPLSEIVIGLLVIAGPSFIIGHLAIKANRRDACEIQKDQGGLSQPTNLRVRVILLVTAMAIAAVMLSALNDAAWDGHASVPLEFRVLDASTGRPIEGASIRLTEGDPAYRATTGPDGRAKLVIRAMTGGRSSVFRSTRSVNYGHWALVISANGYKGLNDKLSRQARGPRYDYDAVPPPIVIRL